MSRLDELIKEYCPNGAPYKRFSEVANYVRGITYGKGDEIKDTIDVGIPVLRANNITLGKNALNLDDIKYVKKSVRVKESQFLHKGDIFICAGSGSKEHVGKVAYISEDMEYAFGGFMAVVRVKNELELLPRYMFHNLTGGRFRKHIGFTIDSSTINNLNAKVVADFTIPVPPLPVQREIVRILDEFTEKTERLKTELTAELEARKRQYEYYTQMIINNSEGDMYKLGEVASLKTGRKPVEIKNNLAEYEYINAGTSNSGYTTDYNCSGDTVTTPSRGQGGIGFVGYQKNRFWLGPLCYRIQSNDDSFLKNHYLYYFLKCFPELILQYKNEGGTPSVNASDLANIILKVPTADKQDEIIAVLNRFDSLCNDISSGLPAEIEARQKQYEYYRDKLLTFKEKEV